MINKQNKTSKNKGFAMVDFMIALGFVGLLYSSVLPLYATYVSLRDHIGENLVENIKIVNLPAEAAALGLTSDSLTTLY